MKKLSLIVLLFLPLLGYVQQFTMNVQAGAYERRKCPVSVSLPKSVSPDLEAILIDQKTKKEVPAQLLSGTNLIFIADSLSANETRTYELTFSKEKKKMVYQIGRAHV